MGLSSGLACVMVIYLWVNDELSFDKYHVNDSRLYQVMTNIKSEKGIDTRKDTPHTLAEVLPLEMPEVEYAVIATPDLFLPEFTLSGNNKKIKGAGKFASKDFFKIFSYHLVQGTESNVLSNKDAIVISESQARNLFRSTDNVIGKTIGWDVAGMKKECIVTGIFKDVPVNSSGHFDFVLSFDALKDIMGMGTGSAIGLSEPFNTYLAVKNGTNIDNFNDKLTRYVRDQSKDGNRSFFLKRFSDNYLYSKYENGKQTGGRIEYVKLFSLIALFILIISAINFMNLSTAKAAKRVKEIGIKKAMGVGRKVLILQYMLESLLMSSLSVIVAVFIVFLLLPQFNEITQKSLHLQFTTELCLALIGITLFTGLLSGSYPALYLSGFKPAMILKGKFNNSIAEQLTRKGLVVFQFSLSVIFIVSVLVVYKQIDYVQNKNLGFDKNNVIYFESDGKAPEAYLNEIQKLPSIESASSMIGNLIGDDFGGTATIDFNGKKIPFRSFGVNYGFIETLGIKIKEGRFFSKNFGSDNSQIILNEAAVEAMGLKNPVGTISKGPGYNTEIIGVVKNFHFQSLHEKIEPMKFRIDNYTASTILAKIKPGKEKEALSNLANLYKKFNPGLTFNYKFLDQDYQALYVSEKQVSVLSRYFAGLSILISCLGLFGLSAFTAEMKIKEIGIRKVLGSSVFGIVRLLSGEFTKMILIAICIALPLSYLIAKNWLDDFAYRINLEWWYFYGAAICTLAIALCTVSYQSIKAAVINPAKSLRSE
ncbi:ABC transporter permease [Mucilaginibacter sp. McL0603]|uniref:ABC transporter permease n=1 Tax=Mucilaginibacter sp. McL0603 TaxID=3415670 RepID=UPI003CE7C0C6